MQSLETTTRTRDLALDKDSSVDEQLTRVKYVLQFLSLHGPYNTDL